LNQEARKHLQAICPDKAAGHSSGDDYPATSTIFNGSIKIAASAETVCA